MPSVTLHEKLALTNVAAALSCRWSQMGDSKDRLARGEAPEAKSPAPVGPKGRKNLAQG